MTVRWKKNYETGRWRQLVWALVLCCGLAGCRANPRNSIVMAASSWPVLTLVKDNVVRENNAAHEYDLAFADVSSAVARPLDLKQSPVRPASYQQETNDQEASVYQEGDLAGQAPGPTLDEPPQSTPDDIQTAPSIGLTLEDVLQSIVDCYPEIDVAIGEIDSANGKVLASWGQFDSTLSAHSISQPLGFYQTYRHGTGINQPLFGGGDVYGNYRIGDGNFEPWYGERETNEGGEFKTGFSLPLLKDSSIDARRAAVRTSDANRDEVVANVQTRLLQLERVAGQAYWDWVASGRAVQIQQRLLRLAQQRSDQIDQRVVEGDLAMIAQIDNARFIAKRENDLIKARRSFEKSAIKMSLFLRDERCQPVIANIDQVPAEFADSNMIADAQRDADIAAAIAIRPEIAELNATRRAACVDLEYARNLTIPKLDLKGFAGKDVGQPASSKGDKTPFEMQVGLYAEVPLQRREGRGKIQSAYGKLAQIDAKLQFTSEKIQAEIQDAASALNAAFNQIQQSQTNVQLTRRSLKLGRQAFEGGDIDLISLNIYETSVADAELQLLDAQFQYFYSQVVYQTAKSGDAFVSQLP